MSIFYGNSFSERFLYAALGRVANRLESIYEESGKMCKRMPIGLFFVIDKENGGNEVSDELLRRFHLIGKSSSSFIDFYYLGWIDYDLLNQVGDDSEINSPEFCLPDFNAIKETFRKEYRINCFNGYADLLLVDVELDDSGEYNKIYFNFQDAIHVDLSKAIKSNDIQSLGEFMERLIDAAKNYREESVNSNSVAHISNKLGILYSKENIVRYIFDKWGKLVGMNNLWHFATSRVGERMEIENYYSN